MPSLNVFVYKMLKKPLYFWDFFFFILSFLCYFCIHIILDNLEFLHLHYSCNYIIVIMFFLKFYNFFHLYYSYNILFLKLNYFYNYIMLAIILLLQLILLYFCNYLIIAINIILAMTLFLQLHYSCTYVFLVIIFFFQNIVCLQYCEWYDRNN